MLYKINHIKNRVAVCISVMLILLNLLCCTKNETISITDTIQVDTETLDDESKDYKNYSLTAQESSDLLATVNETLKISNPVSTQSQSAKTKIKKNNPSTEFLSYFKLNQVPVVKKYKYDNLELLYRLEQFVNNRSSENIEKYYNKYSDVIKKRLSHTVFLGNINIENLSLVNNFLNPENTLSLSDKSLSEQFAKISQYDFSNVNEVIMCNGFTSHGIIDSNEYVSVCDKLCNIIKSKKPEIKIYICSLPPVSLATYDINMINQYNDYNYKSIEINKMLSEQYNDLYIDTNSLIELDDFESDGILSKNYWMKMICYLTNCMEVKSDILDAPLPDALKIEYKEPEGKNIYITFDDGPSANGQWLLSILEKYDVKATIFYTGNSAEYRQNIIDFSNANQKIAAHTFTHNYKIYKSEEKYFEDLYKIESLLKTLTGSFTRIVRFPGGSSNTASKNYSIGIMKKIVEDFKLMGYVYYDWNVSSGDGSKNITSKQILANAKEGVEKYNNSVVLFHETHNYTVAVIEDFIKWAKSKGYEFRTLDYDTLKCHQSYSKIN